MLEIKEWKTRKIKHALFFSKSTTFYVKTPRYKCQVCKKTFTQKNSYALSRSRVSHETVNLVLNALAEYNSTEKSTANLFHISVTTVQNIFDKYVNYVRKPLPKVLSIDEIYNNSQFSAAYTVILFDFLNKKIVDVILDRRKSNLNVYFNKITREERDRVEYVIIDMWEPYFDIAKLHFRNAIIAIDSFHVMQHFGRALDNFRCRIMKKYDKKSRNYRILKKYHYLLKQAPTPWNDKQKVKYFNKLVNEYDILNEILKMDPEIKIVYEYYMRYKNFNKYSSFDDAKTNFDHIVTDMDGVLVPEFVDVINTLMNWKDEIINSFLLVDNFRLSNGPIEGANSQVKKLMRVANGFGNFLRFRNKFMHCYNKEISLTPVRNQITKIKRKSRGKYKKSRQN